MKRFGLHLMLHAVTACSLIHFGITLAIGQVMMQPTFNNQLDKPIVRKTLTPARDKQLRTDLHWAAIWAEAEQMEQLLSSGADVMQKDYLGNTPLHYAVMYYTNVLDRMRTISKLLTYGADIYTQNTAGYSPIDLAYNYIFRKMLLDFGIAGVLL